MHTCNIMISVLGGLLGLALLAAGPAGAGDEPARCGECGMYTAKSSTRVQADVTILGKTTFSEFCSFGCLHSTLQEGGGKGKLKQLTVLDYSTFGKKAPTFVDGLSAWYLHGTKPLRGSMPPNIAAFATKAGAEKAQAELGGELVEGWAALSKKMTAAKAKDKPKDDKQGAG